MAMFLTDIDARLEHQRREGNAADPGPERKDEENGKDEEDYPTRPVPLDQVEDGRPERPSQVEDASDPYKLLWKDARQPDVSVREHKGDDEAEGEEYNGVAVEREAVEVIVDAVAVEAAAVAVDRDARDGDKACKGKEKKESRP